MAQDTLLGFPAHTLPYRRGEFTTLSTASVPAYIVRRDFPIWRDFSLRQFSLTGVELVVAAVLGQQILVMHPDSTIREFDLSALPYPRDVEQPALRALKSEITDECRRPSTSA